LSEAVNSVLRRLDAVLQPHGFHRHKQTWNRRADSLVDVVDLQVDKSRTMMTVNVGVLSPEVHRKAWLSELPGVVDEAYCTVRSRLGYLVANRDMWWPIDAERSADEIADILRSQALRFLERLHSAGALERHLEGERAADSRYPPPAIYLALLKHQRGDQVGCQMLLQEVRARTGPTWRERVDQVLLDLSLDQADS